jgi:hypothetical protein
MWGMKQQFEETLRSNNAPQFSIDLGSQLVGMRKVVDPQDFAPSPGSTSKEICSGDLFNKESAHESDEEDIDIWGSGPEYKSDGRGTGVWVFQ